MSTVSENVDVVAVIISAKCERSEH